MYQPSSENPSMCQQNDFLTGFRANPSPEEQNDQFSRFSPSTTDGSNYQLNPTDETARLLDCKFQIGPYDVWCSRGKRAFFHEGNRRFRTLIAKQLPKYAAAQTKREKSKVVSLIVDTIRNSSPLGGFVKQVNGKWVEVGDRHAR